MFKYIFLFLLFFIAFVIYKAPASILQHYLNHTVLTGKLIDGKAHHDQIGEISFKFNPMQLLKGEVGVDVDIKNNTNYITTNVALNIFTDIVINNTSGNISLDYIKVFASKWPKHLNAISTEFNIKQLRASFEDYNNPIPYELSADIVAKNVITMGEKLGDYDITSRINKDHTEFKIINTENSLLYLDANLNITDGKLEITGEIKGKNSNITTLLQNLRIDSNLNHTIKL